MNVREPVDFTKGKYDVIEQLAEGDSTARTVLTLILRHAPDAMNTFIDIADMNLRGRQLVTAYSFCAYKVQLLVDAVYKREKGLVAYVNEKNPDLPPAREHGEQKRVSQVDFAMQGALQAQQMDGLVKRIDEGSEHVHNFFLTVAKQMQADKKFQLNMRVNTGLEGANTLVFVIALADVLDINGNSANNSPIKEDARIADVTAQIAQERGDVSPLPPEVQKAMNEGRW